MVEMIILILTIIKELRYKDINNIKYYIQVCLIPELYL